MPDPIQTNTPTPPTTPQANSPDARLPTGEIRDLQSTSPSTTDGTQTSSDSGTSEGGEPQPKAPAAPETYAEFKFPEGTKVDKARLDSALPIFREANLSQDQAQKLVDWYTKLQTDDAKAGVDLVAAMHAEWGTKLASDPEIGSKLDSVKVDIGRALSHLGPAETAFRSAMDLTGAGNHPDVIKGLYKLSQLIGEGRPVTGTSPSPHGQTPNGVAKRPNAASAFYPNLPSSTS